MPELLLELFSEEIPARMQMEAANRLAHLLRTSLAPLNADFSSPYYTPRRIAVWGQVDPVVAATNRTERGPRVSAPEAALQGFLRKHQAGREHAVQEGDYWVLHIGGASQTATDLIGATLPGLLRRFPWPKSMRWGAGSQFTWVRPLKRILCVLDREVVPFDLVDGSDDGHGLRSGSLTEGHRFMNPGAFEALSSAAWNNGLAERHVIANPAGRRDKIQFEVDQKARSRGLVVVEDSGLLEEVTGLVEWPVPLLGRIDSGFMDLPAEVMQVSMRVNQRYFALRDAATGRPAPWFAFVANIEAPDGGAAIIAGNERVLRARFADARHFWDLDRAATLESRVAALGAITFHHKLGTQADRVRRLERLAAHIAPLVGAETEHAARAARLAKADLTTGMVGEFPELQGVMGGYYARHDGEHPDVAQAIQGHYLPRGPADPLPCGTVATAVALADKLDTLTGFFGIGELPTGSGDPYALRRAALGVIRILREGGLRLALRPIIGFAGAGHAAHPDPDVVLGFLAERLRVQLRAEGARHDVLNAVFAAGGDDDIIRLLARAEAVAALLATEAGADLLASYRRAANIGRIEDRRDGPHTGPVDPALFTEPAERRLATALADRRPAIAAALAAEDDATALQELASLRGALDDFFQTVRVADVSAPELRVNRLRLLANLLGYMNLVADFSSIEG